MKSPKEEPQMTVAQADDVIKRFAHLNLEQQSTFGAYLIGHLSDAA